MCGRYNLTSRPEVVATLFNATITRPWTPRYNIAPTQEAPVVLERDGRRTVEMLRWGLVPSWADDPAIGNRMINARSEEIESKPAYRNAFKRRRCLVPADGFYEWRPVPGARAKQPFLIRMRGGGPFALAGVWEHWSRGAEQIDSFSILTTDANELVRGVHDRMPVVIAPDDYAAWLGSSDAAPVKPLLRPFDPAGMEMYPVSTRVNRPQNDDPECIEPLTA